MSDSLRQWRWRSFDRVLSHLCRERSPRSVLEWGPGYSTEIILKHSSEAKILSVEHDPKYVRKMTRRFEGDDRVEIVHRALTMKAGKSTGYVNYPAWRSVKEHGEVKRQYDLVFVDGRSRFDCLVTARQLAKEDGVVVLHDSHRKAYRPAVGLFPHVLDYDERRTIVMSLSPLDWMSDFDPAPTPNTVMNNEDTLADLHRRFDEGSSFTYLRFGDADLFFMQNPKFTQNKRHDPSPEMTRELKKAFTIDHPDYLVGCVANGKVFKKYDQKLKAISQQYHEGGEYYSAVAFHSMYAENPEKFAAWVRDCFWDRKVLMIGGISVCRNLLVRKAFNVADTIELSDRNAYSMLNPKMGQIEGRVPNCDVVVSALGQATRVLGGRLWDRGVGTMYFDVGSTVDALAERHLRSWIRRHKDKVETYKKMFL